MHICTTELNNWKIELIKKEESNVIGNGGYLVSLTAPKMSSMMNYDTMEKAMVKYCEYLTEAEQDPNKYVREWEEELERIRRKQIKQVGDMAVDSLTGKTVKILEFSEWGEMVRILFLDGSSCWADRDDIL